MKISTTRFNLSPSSQRWDCGVTEQQFTIPDRCPNCHAYGTFPIAGAFGSPDSPQFSTGLFYCNHCQSFFMAEFVQDAGSSRIHHLVKTYDIDNSQPQFSDLLQQMSSEFCETYKEAIEAEANGLKRIAGPGYRKALEFLVKDFAKRSANSEVSDKIDHMNLMQIIKTYINHSSILHLARAATWLGNDQTHTAKKYNDYDLEDLKRFILAVAKYIDLELTTEEALVLLEHKKE